MSSTDMSLVDMSSTMEGWTTGPAHGTLLLVGGGKIGPEIWERFLGPAGGIEGRIVIIPTAHEDSTLGEDATSRDLKARGVKDVVILHTRDRREADTERFVTPLKAATGVWLTGGRQWRLADAYLHTRTQAEIEAVLRRGGVVGGTSAGATMQGSFLVRGDTAGNVLMEGDHQRGFGFLRNAAVDQHVLRRNRQFDLIPVIAAHPELLGLGIDEGTALAVQGSRAEVVGASYVAVYDARDWTVAERAWPNAAAKGQFHLLAPGQQFDLGLRTTIADEHCGIPSRTLSSCRTLSS